MRHLALTLITALLVAGVARGDGPAEQTPRERYNAALTAYDGQSLDAARDGFLEARAEAGSDGELRYRTAFNLGMTFAAQSDQVRDEDPQRALELLHQSADFFSDAIRQAPEDEDARVNLQIIQRRILALTEELNRAENTLEKRLTALIESERGLLASVQELIEAIQKRGVSAEPTAFREDFRRLATSQRALLAEANTVYNLAADERQLIEEKAEDARTQEEQVRAMQLQLLMRYLDQGREEMLDARRDLRKLQSESAHRRTARTVRLLKRALEQLGDPLQVLRAVAGEQTQVFAFSRKVAEASAMVSGSESLPAWLSTTYLGDQQRNLEERTTELGMRLAVGSAQAQAEMPQASGAAGVDPRQQQVLEAAAEAAPFIQSAAGSMTQARAALEGGDAEGALEHQERALEDLAEALERFSDLKSLVEIAFQTQRQVVQLLSPEEEGGAVDLSPEALEALREGFRDNTRRLEQMQGLISDELAVLEQQRAEAEQGAASGQPTPPEQLEALQKEAERLELAEKLRGEALVAVRDSAELLTELEQALAERAAAETPPPADGGDEGAGGDDAQAGSQGADPGVDPAASQTAALPPLPDPRARAEVALERLETMRTLFFTLIEHLKELARREGESADETAAAEGITDPAEQAMRVGSLAAEQRRNGEMADAIAEALREQAASEPDTSQMNPQQVAQMKEAREKMTQAATEVASASTAMQEAASALEINPSADFERAKEQELAALEHLARAIALLEPPNQQQQKQQKQQQQQQQKQQEKRQMERRMQAARENEAKRRREKRKQSERQSAPVEKDW